MGTDIIPEVLAAGGRGCDRQRGGGRRSANSKNFWRSFALFGGGIFGYAGSRGGSFVPQAPDLVKSIQHEQRFGDKTIRDVRFRVG